MDKTGELAKLRSNEFLEQHAVALGMLLGPVLGVVFTFARVGPPGFIWWEGKGHETLLTDLGKVIVTTIFIVGMVAGAFSGWALNAVSRGETAPVRPKLESVQDRLWDPDVDA